MNRRVIGFTIEPEPRQRHIHWPRTNNDGRKPCDPWGISMPNEERDIINQFIARVGGAPAASGFASGSVPATQAPPLPPVDPEANTLIGQMFQRYPETAYRMTQLAFVQEQGLIQAQSRIQQLEAQLTQARQAAQQAQQQPQQQSGGGFFSGLFGGGRQQAAPPPPPNPG